MWLTRCHGLALQSAMFGPRLRCVILVGDADVHTSCTLQPPRRAMPVVGLKRVTTF